MSGDRRKKKQATLADLHSNFRSMLPSHAVPRGRLKNALVETARGVGKSQFVIPDRWMKYPQNETSNVVDNRKSHVAFLASTSNAVFVVLFHDPTFLQSVSSLRFVSLKKLITKISANLSTIPLLPKQC